MFYIAGQLCLSCSWWLFCYFVFFQRPDIVLLEQWDWYWVRHRRRNIKTQSGVDIDRQGRLWGRGLLLCCHCLCSVVLLHREIHSLCWCVDVSSWLRLSMVWSHTHTLTHTPRARLVHPHTDSAFTIRLSWHLNNELSLFALPRLSPPVEVRLSGLVTVAHIQY